MRLNRLVWVAVSASLLLVVGCGDDGDDGTGGGGGTTTSTTTDTGGGGGNGGNGGGMAATPEEYYNAEASARLGSATNESTCATCHSNDGAQAGFSGNTFQDIAYLTSYKGGGAPTLLDGSNACITGWMGGTALTEADEEWTMLKEYMESISDPGVTTPNALVPEVLADEAAYEAAYAGGDAAAGEMAYATSCGRCHAGNVVVGSATSPSTTGLGVYSVGRIAQQVRTSGPPPSGTADANDSTPGPMPFFEEKDLSTQDLADIAAYLTSM